MLNAVLFALRDIPTSPFRAVLLKSIGLTLALLAVVWIGVFAAADHFTAALPDTWRTTADWLTGLLLFVGLGFLVAPVTALFAGLYADEIAEVVERTRYPTERPGVSQPLMISLLQALRFTGFVVLVNIAMLPLLFLPGINIPIFLAVNAYLLGREYFEQVAMRFYPPEIAQSFRSAHSGKVMLGGLTIALLLAVPIVNILTPLYATALMVHVVKLAERQDQP